MNNTTQRDITTILHIYSFIFVYVQTLFYSKDSLILLLLLLLVVVVVVVVVVRS